MNVHAPRIHPPLFIGVDGGGSGCRARIEDADGRRLGAGTAGPATLRFGIDRALTEVETACRAAAAEAGLAPSALAEMDAGVGLAGTGRKGVLEALKARPHPFRSVVYVNDANIACIGAHSGRDGGIVIIGTGSAGLAMVERREVKVGGYGFPISDEGSGADLGLRGVRLAMRAFDGRIAATRLTEDIMVRFGNDPFAVVAWMDHATATDYATLAPLVMRHAQSGDAVGRRIVRDAAEEIDALAGRLIECGARRIALIGGLASPMEPWLAPEIRRHLVPAQGDAIAGALHLARQQRRAVA
jgi:glucosamine kinase